MEILYLKVKKRYFDLIREGIKKEDYREIKPFWKKRLLNRKDLTKFRTFDAVHIQNGYMRGSPWVLLKFTEITIKKPRPEWAPGFPSEHETFAVGFGEVIDHC